MNGSSFAGIPCETSAHSSSGIRDGHVISRTRDMVVVVLRLEGSLEVDGSSGERVMHFNPKVPQK